MRRATVTAAFVVGALVLAACGASEPSTVALPAVSTVSTSTAVVGDEVAIEAEPAGPLSVEAALLPDDAFGAPWEHTGSRLDNFGYDTGPNQSDCDPYWLVESVISLGGGNVTWWSEGGNVNHYVARVDDPQAYVDAARAVPEQCPRVSWSEGDSFSATALDIGEGVAAFEAVTDPATDRSWFAVTARGDLVSMLWIPLWPTLSGDEFLAISVDDLGAVAQQMRTLLLAAPEVEPASITTTTPPPPPTPPPTPPTPPTTTEPVAVTQPEVAPVPTLPANDPSGLSNHLLTADQVPNGWDLVDIEPYIAEPMDDAFIRACIAAMAFDTIDVGLEWRAQWTGPSASKLQQIVGRMPSVGEASDAVELLAEVGSCDLSVPLDGGQASGGAAELPGTTAATRLVFSAEPPQEVFLEIVVFAIDDLVMVFTAETLGEGGMPVTAAMDAAAVAVTLVSGGR